MDFSVIAVSLQPIFVCNAYATLETDGKTSVLIVTWLPHRKVGSCSLLVSTPAAVAGKGGFPHFFYDYRLWSNLDSLSFHRDKQWSFVTFISSCEPHAHIRTQLLWDCAETKNRRTGAVRTVWGDQSCLQPAVEGGGSPKKLWDIVGQCCRQCLLCTNSLAVVKDVTTRSFKQGFAGELKQKRKRTCGYLWASAPSVKVENGHP